MSDPFATYAQIEKEKETPEHPFKVLVTRRGERHEIQVRPSMTILTLKSQLHAAFGGDFARYSLFRQGKPLVDHKTVKESKILPGHVITFGTKVVGGSQLPGVRGLPKRKHTFQPAKYPFIDTTEKPDTVLSVCQKNDPRVLLPCCGVALCAESVFGWTKRLFEKDLSTYEVFCLMPKCRTVWHWEFVWRAADMNDAEKLQFDLWREKRMTKALQKLYECPKCHHLAHPPKHRAFTRCNCPECRTNFCIWCEQLWRGAGKQVCGNENCESYHTVELLRTCPMISTENKHYTYKVPEWRACPKCLHLIRHEKNCKHVTCPDCECRFCFLCMGIYDGRWHCGSAGDDCAKDGIAPRQTLRQ